MLLSLLGAPVMAGAAWLGPANYWECILDGMPGAKNDLVATEIMRACAEDFPRDGEIEEKAPLFGIRTAGECALKYGEEVSSPVAAQQIRTACYRLYPSR
jgi:hypothetical protein